MPSRILALFHENSHLKKIYLTSDFHKDIQWFLTFLPSFNGMSFIKKNGVDPEQSLYLDDIMTSLYLDDYCTLLAWELFGGSGFMLPPYKILGV